ncbi:MAG: hypothetical protein ACTHN5_19520 [Phycisphaerae bacterium]
MHTLLAGALAQVKTLDSATPRIGDTPSSATTWIIVAILVVAILLITFKTARRNHNILEE